MLSPAIDMFVRSTYATKLAPGQCGQETAVPGGRSHDDAALEPAVHQPDQRFVETKAQRLFIRVVRSARGLVEDQAIERSVAASELEDLLCERAKRALRVRV